MEGLLFQASIYLLAAVIAVPLAMRLGLGSVLGYLAAGIVIGPVLGLVGSESSDLQHVAEFGVVLMLFLIGLELEPRGLWSMRHKLVGLGGLQIVLTMAAIAGIVVWLGRDLREGVVIGMILALSSTAIVLQTLNEKNLMRSNGGRSAFAVLLMQDIAVVPMLAVVPLLATGAILPPDAAETAAAETAAEAAPEAAQTLLAWVDALPGWGVTGLTLAIVATIILGGHYLTMPVFRFVHAARLPEMSTFIALLIVMGIAFLMTLVGLSPALGTFLAGVVLANSEFRHQLHADIEPFRGLLMGLFFITVGAGIDFAYLAAQPLTILAVTLGLIAVKAAILAALALAFRIRGRDRLLFALGLAQAGEFGFLLISFALQQNALSEEVAQTLLLAIGLSMLLTPILFIAHDRLARLFSDARGDDVEPDEIDEQGRVIVAGVGRFGQVVNRLVRMSGIGTTVLDNDLATIRLLRRFGVKGFFGDPSRPELLHAAGLAEADILVVAVDNPAAATKIVRYARSLRDDLHIIARARDRVHVYELNAAGANDVVRETFDASIRAGRYVLENAGFTDYEAAQMAQTYYKVDRMALRELSELWRPGIPVHENEAYVARSRQLDADLETALMEHLEERQNRLRKAG